MAEETPLERFRRQVLPGRTVKEVTDVIERTCKSMKPGQMVHSETFTLMEAVSAIELGDPKVDIGVIPEARDTGLPTDLFKVTLSSPSPSSFYFKSFFFLFFFFYLSNFGFEVSDNWILFSEHRRGERL